LLTVPSTLRDTETDVLGLVDRDDDVSSVGVCVTLADLEREGSFDEVVLREDDIEGDLLTERSFVDDNELDHEWVWVVVALLLSTVVVGDDVSVAVGLRVTSGVLLSVNVRESVNVGEAVAEGDADMVFDLENSSVGDVVSVGLPEAVQLSVPVTDAS
jgi:hypothetical protein